MGVGADALERTVIRLRLANQTDAHAIAALYTALAPEMPSSFVARLGYPFLLAYHRVMLREPHSVVVVAEDEGGRVVGFVSGSLDTSEHLKMLRKHRLSIAAGTLPAILRSPRILLEVYRRQPKKDGSSDSEFVAQQGPRLEFWGTLPVARASAVLLLKTWLAVMRDLGAGDIVFEVDEEHEAVGHLHKALGAILVKHYVTPDGRSRSLMKYENVT